ncbi:MAG: MFS transporter [Bacteroidota bacterium]|nr:MFS transporter [Bacteroidota bacterium]
MKAPVLSENSNLRYVTFFYLYVMQGIPAGFALTAIANYLAGKNISSDKIGTFIALDGLPWILQFLWGPLIDRFQFSSMGNRKHWIVFSQLAGVLVTTGLFFVGQPEDNLSLLGAIFFTYSICASVQVASVDAMAITIAPATERGRMNGFMRGGFLLGIAFSSTLFSMMLHNYSFKAAAMVQTITLAAFSMLFFFTKLEGSNSLLPSFKKINLKSKEQKDPPFKTVFKNVYKGIAGKQSLQYFALVALVYFCSSIFIRSYTYHLIHVLKWPDNQVSYLQGGWGSMVTFVAILVAGSISDKIGHKKLQVKVTWAVCVFLVIVNVTSSFWNYKYYSGAALILWNFADPLLSVTIFPILMGLCIKKVEGSQFTTYLALINLCDVLGSYVTGWSLTQISAPTLGLICATALLLFLVIIKFKNNYRIIPDI